MDRQTRAHVAKTLRAAAAALSASKYRIEEYPSPQKYNHTAKVMRFALVDPDARPVQPGEIYFDDTFRMIKYTKRGELRKKPLKEQTGWGAKEGVIAWLDFTPYGGNVFLDFLAVRDDARSKRHAQRLLDHLYKKYKGKVDFIDWGKIMHPHSEILFNKYKNLEDAGFPYTKGKLW